MALEYLNDTPERAYRKLERDLLLQSPEINMRRYKSMTPRRLGEAITKLDSELKGIISESRYGSWLSDDTYVSKKLLQDALSCLKEYKEDRKENETVVPGFTYYRRVKQFGPVLEGERCYFREDAPPLWAKFKMPLAVAKACEVLQHGSEDDFKTIYIEMANGRLDALDIMSMEHLTESSPDALTDIEKYCDERWSGPWPWETPTPYTLRESIEDRLQMTYDSIQQMQVDFGKTITQLNEDEMDKFQVIAKAEEFSDTIEKMVQQVARLGGEGIITLKDQVRVTMGDESAEQIANEFIDPVRDAADALSKLRATIDQTINTLKSGDSAGGGGGAMGDLDGGEPELGGDLGTDMGGDLEGGDLGGDDLAGDLSTASVDGEPEERAMKGM